MKATITMQGTVSRVGEAKKNDQGQVFKYVTVDYEGGAINAPCGVSVIPPVGSKVNLTAEGKMEQVYMFKRIMAVAVPQSITSITERKA